MKQFLSDSERMNYEKFMVYRKINAAVWCVLFITILGMCLYYWDKVQPCTIAQFLAAVSLYLVSCGALWFVVDQSLKEQQ